MKHRAGETRDSDPASAGPATAQETRQQEPAGLYYDAWDEMLLDGVPEDEKTPQYFAYSVLDDETYKKHVFSWEQRKFVIENPDVCRVADHLPEVIQAEFRKIAANKNTPAPFDFLPEEDSALDKVFGDSYFDKWVQQNRAAVAFETTNNETSETPGDKEPRSSAKPQKKRAALSRSSKVKRKSTPSQ